MHIRWARLLSGVVFSVLLTQTGSLGIASAQSTGTQGFNDLGDVPWAAQAITDMHDRGVLQGTAAGTFDPNGQLDRAQLATALGRMEGWSANAGNGAAHFRDWDDVPTWARPYVAAASERHIVEGMPGGFFAPADRLKWDDLSVIVARAFNYPPVPADQVDSVLAQLPDGPKTPDWAKQAVAEDVVAGDFAGVLTDLYNPNKPVSRAELALFLDQAAQGLQMATSVSMSPTPIAPNGSLAAGQSVSVTVYAKNSVAQPAAGDQVFLSLGAASGGGSASVNGTSLTSTPTAFATGKDGSLTVTYKAPAKLPSSGTDTLTVATPQGTASATDTYTFESAPPTVTGLAIQPNPIAATGRLKAGQTVTTVVYATYDKQAAAGAQVYLSLSAASGGGSASVNGTALTSTPTAFTAGKDGSITVTYKAPAKLPTSGTDSLTAANAASNAKVTATDTYSFAPSGTVTGLSITVKLSSGETGTFVLAPDVKVTKDGMPATLSDIGPGSVVTVALNAQGQASTIDIQS